MYDDFLKYIPSNLLLDKEIVELLVKVHVNNYLRLNNQFVHDISIIKTAMFYSYENSACVYRNVLKQIILKSRYTYETMPSEIKEALIEYLKFYIYKNKINKDSDNKLDLKLILKI